MTEIIPAILPSSVDDLLEKISALPQEVEPFHFDVLDSDIWEPVGKNFEAHLMVSEPESIISRWVERGAKRVIVHELKGIDKGNLNGIELGLGVEMHVQLEEVFALISQVDFVHLMSIAEIGEQGHPFEPKVFDRIKELREKFPNLILSVDGGVNAENFKELEKLGVDRVVVGKNFKEVWQSQTSKSKS